MAAPWLFGSLHWIQTRRSAIRTIVTLGAAGRNLGVVHFLVDHAASESSIPSVPELNGFTRKRALETPS